MMKPSGTLKGTSAGRALSRRFLFSGLALALIGSTFIAGCMSNGGSRRRHLTQQNNQLEAQNEIQLTGTDVEEPTTPENDLGDLATDGSGLRETSGLRLGQSNDGSPAGILKELERKERMKLLEAKSQLRAGNRAYEAGDFKRAIEYFRQALNNDPTLAEARQKMNTAMQLSGDRSGEAGNVANDVASSARARKEQHTEELERGLREAKELINKGEFEQAKKNLAGLAETFGYENYYSRDVTAEEGEVKNLLRRVGDLQIDAERNKRMKEEEMVREAANEERERELRHERQKIRELTSKAADYIKFNNYKKAIESCEHILRLDPNNHTASWWLKIARRQLIDQRKTKVIKLREELDDAHRLSYDEAKVPWVDPFTFPDKSTWDEIKKRQRDLEVVSADDPPAVLEIKNKLNTYKIEYIEFKEEPINQVVLQLQNLLGINMRLDPNIEGVEDITVTMTLSNMRAVDALDNILKATGLARTFNYGILTITSAEGAKGENTFFIYNVSDILNKIRDFPGPELRLKPSDEEDGGSDGGVSFESEDGDEETAIDSDGIITLIQSNTGNSAAWDGEEYTIEFEKGLLLVNAPVDVHGQIRSVLANLRKDSDIFVMIEARFIDITDDFLEDIGVDYRSLGQVNNLGTPFGNLINDNRSGGNDLGFVKQGSPENDTTLVKGQDRWAGRLQNIVDGFTGIISGDRLGGGANGIGGLSLQSTWLDPFQLNAIFRAVTEKSDVRQLTAPTITAHNGERVFVSVITQRAYIADYELVSGGTGFSIIEVADPVVRTFQEGVILDVDPVISPDKKYITLDVRPTMATLIGGVISTILISLGSFTSVAFEVPIGVPQISLQQSFTSVTVPNGGTVLLGGFKSLSEAKYNSRIPFLGEIPIIKNLFRRKAQYSEKRSLVLLITARIINPREEEARQFNEI